MAFSLPQADLPAGKRAVLYLRVSTGRQATGDVSIPSQRDLTQRFCLANNWQVVDEFVEPGASGTDDRRPVLQKMIEQAKEGRFDVICVHSFSRFYRNGAEMELTIRNLRKYGVEVVSMTQPTGDDPSQTLMRQIIGIFDEYTSRENGKNVTRAMRENAKQGFWNGAKPPLGYRICDVELRGTKMKKCLEVDPVDAETVRLIFRLYAEGDGQSGPIGVKKVTEWLNSNGYRTRVGAAFGIGPVHGILTNKCYATGKWPYGVKNFQTKQKHDPSTVIEINIPTIVPMELFEQVQRRLSINNPKVTPPRVVNGPTLLAGLAVCASCGSGMTKSGTRRRGKIYSYYSCAGCKLGGRSVCKGGNIPLEKLDGLILDNVTQQLFNPERMGVILGALVKRTNTKDAALDDRWNRLQAERKDKQEKLTRLYRAIEEGIVELDDDLKVRIATIKQERDIVQTSLDRIHVQATNSYELTPDRIAAFAKLAQDKLLKGDAQARRAYLRSIITRIEVSKEKVRIIGDTNELAGAVSGRKEGPQNVRGYVRNWRALQESNLWPQD